MNQISPHLLGFTGFGFPLKSLGFVELTARFMCSSDAMMIQLMNVGFFAPL